jgi:hypothetical protein
MRREGILNTLVYLVYGPKREYQLELTYSVLSAVHKSRPSEHALRIVLISDEANRRSDLPLENVVISAPELANWTRQGTYHYEAKIHALARALDLFQGRAVLMDTDTYFNVDPARLFERTGPQRSVMHAYEGPLGTSSDMSPILERLPGPPLSNQISRHTRIFNSGVIGLDYADRHLLPEVLQLVHELYEIYPVFSIEQFAVSIVLDRSTKLADCSDLVTHYYGYQRGFIQAQIAQLFPQFTAERFQAHTGDLPKVGGFPKKRLWDRLIARWNSLSRREGLDYHFAYLAYLSAHSSARRSHVHANVWAHVALDVLRRNQFPISYVERDFRAMRGLKGRTWASVETRKAWTSLWRSLSEDKQRGLLRMTPL